MYSLNSSPAETTDDDAELLRRTADGDRAAFERLYFRLYNPLHRFIGRVTHHGDLCEEILNETMLTVWQKADSFHGDSKVSTWVFGIAYRKSLKALEKSRRWNSRMESMSDTLADTTAAVGQPDEKLTQLQIQQRIDRGLKLLNPEQRTAFELTFYFGYSYAEIAQICHCSVNTVKTRMFHARRRLQVHLEINQ
jgi:RNA polymerase sigma-70 factor (ECF subfamily)